MCSNKESPLFSISSSQFFKTKHLKNAFTSIPVKLHPARDLFLILSYVHPEYISVQYISNKASCLKTIEMSVKTLFFFFFSCRNSCSFHNLRCKQKCWCNTAVSNAQSSPICQWVGEYSNHKSALASFWSFISVIKGF